MLHQDHITFAMLLAKISLKGITRCDSRHSVVWLLLSLAEV